MNVQTRSVAPQTGVVRFNLLIPVTRIGVGVFSFDPVERALGAPIRQVLNPWMRAPWVPAHPNDPGNLETYPLQLVPGEGANLPLAELGELGFSNVDGRLRLTVPTLAAPVVWAAARDHVVGAPIPGISADGRSTVTHFDLVLKSGVRFQVRVGTLGSIALEGG